jgi:zinc protease
MRRSPWALALLAALTIAPAARAAAPTTFQLPNGLHVLFAPDSLAAGVDVAVWYRAGTAWEPAGRSGLSSLMARLMFRGSPHYAPGEYARLLNEQGMSFNTFLAPDYSCFYATGASGALETAIQLEADRMAGQRLTAENVTADKAALREERRRLESNPLTRGLQQLEATAFGAHGYAAPLSGKAADFDKLTPAACTAYAKDRYGPADAWLTLVGRFDPAVAEPLVRRWFGAIPRRDPGPAPAAAFPAPRERRARITVESRLPILFAGWRAPADSVCGVELEVMARLLGSNSGGRLVDSLTGRRLALAAQCDADTRRQACLLFALATPAPGADTSDVEDALIDGVERLARDTISVDELARAKQPLLLAARLDRQSSHGRAQGLGAATMLSGDWRDDERRLARLEAMQPRDVNRVAAMFLDAQHRSVVWAVPSSPAPTGGRP